MTFTRRMILQAGTAAVCARAGLATANSNWPHRPVKILVPVPPGGAVDAVSRTLASQLAVVWGGNRTAFVENKAGGNTVIAAQALLNEPRDGHSFLATFNLTRQLPNLGLKLAFNPLTDLVPVGPVITEQMMLVVSAKAGVKDFQSLIAKIRSNPTGASFGTFGMGGLGHLTALQMAKVLNLNITSVHYRGVGPGVQGMLTGEIDMFLTNIGAAQQFIDTGKLVPIAVTGAKRYHFVPHLPTFGELGIKDLDLVSWIGMFAARGTPTDVLQKMSADMKKALQSAEVISKFHAFYLDPGQQSLEEFQAIVEADDQMAGSLIKQHGVRLQ